jgi:hypothetical protein
MSETNSSSQSISSTNMQAAYVYNDKAEKQRIEAYGKANKDFLRSLIRTEPAK